MPKTSQDDYLPFDDYREMLGVFQGISGLLLFDFDHACGDEMFLPVVNSPRMGVCGYTGEA